MGYAIEQTRFAGYGRVTGFRLYRIDKETPKTVIAAMYSGGKFGPPYKRVNPDFIWRGDDERKAKAVLAKLDKALQTRDSRVKLHDMDFDVALAAAVAT